MIFVKRCRLAQQVASRWHGDDQMRRTLALVTWGVLAMPSAGVAQPVERGALIESAAEELSEGDAENHSGKGGCVGENSVATAPVRAGRHSFRHEVRNCAERAEIAMGRTEIGKTYWLGWSLFIPAEYEQTSKGNIFAQWAAYPNKTTTKFPCRGVGHKLELDNGWLEYHLQGSDAKSGNAGGFCKHFQLAPFNEALKGKWIDFVQHAHWTGDETGFVKLWMKVGDEEFKLVVDYRGRTWWNDEDHGPYFKMGLYTGDPGWEGRSPAVVYTDEYRLCGAEGGPRDVAADPSSVDSILATDGRRAIAP
jgi:hypothetical protein